MTEKTDDTSKPHNQGGTELTDDDLDLVAGGRATVPTQSDPVYPLKKTKLGSVPGLAELKPGAKGVVPSTDVQVDINPTFCDPVDSGL
jgi:hypothetical protein